MRTSYPLQNWCQRCSICCLSAWISTSRVQNVTSMNNQDQQLCSAFLLQGNIKDQKAAPFYALCRTFMYTSDSGVIATLKWAPIFKKNDMSTLKCDLQNREISTLTSMSSRPSTLLCGAQRGCLSLYRLSAKERKKPWAEIKSVCEIIIVVQAVNFDTCKTNRNVSEDLSLTLFISRLLKIFQLLTEPNEAVAFG